MVTNTIIVVVLQHSENIVNSNLAFATYCLQAFIPVILFDIKKPPFEINLSKKPGDTSDTIDTWSVSTEYYNIIRLGEEWQIQ